MEHGNLLVPPVTEPSPPADRLNAREWSLLRRFRVLKPSDQAALLQLMEGLAALTELED
ncbi:hypothetical protein [Pseudomonas citronellolis]|uniref:hypothetical protein n=1 Tax=Pseudomonas citronellolis TaxID=53408 RepID=UPI0023E3E85A|nr:hypothetical protein [Pseudomonas citronellolis]MDF3935338.1 hypothetical protein [Pseudomonas citronellolis]